MLTRKDVLEKMRDEGLTALVDAEFSIKLLSRMIITNPNDDTNNKNLLNQRNRREALERNIAVVDEMIAEEVKKNPGVAEVK